MKDSSVIRMVTCIEDSLCTIKAMALEFMSIAMELDTKANFGMARNTGTVGRRAQMAMFTKESLIAVYVKVKADYKQKLGGVTLVIGSKASNMVRVNRNGRMVIPM